MNRRDKDRLFALARVVGLLALVAGLLCVFVWAVMPYWSRLLNYGLPEQRVAEKLREGK